MARLTAIMILLVQGIAQAKPAVIKVFESPAFAKPNKKSKQLHLFIEGTEVSLSEEPRGEWYRVRLPNGAAAWIHASALKMIEEPATAAEVAAPEATADSSQEAAETSKVAAETSKVAAEATIYIKDLPHLAELVAEDPVVGPRAQKLVKGQQGAWAVAGVMALGGLVALVAALRTADEGAQNRGLYLAAILPPGGYLIGLLMHPSRNDILDLINSWNQRHPNRELHLDNVAHKR